MKADADAAARFLAELSAQGHAGLLSQPDEGVEPLGGRRLYLPYLGARRLEWWAGWRVARLRAMLAGLASARGARALGVRGRVRRLLGDKAGARADLRAAARAGWPLAHAWLGELEIVGGPDAALAALARARRAGVAEEDLALWTGAAELERVRFARGLSALAGCGLHAAALLRGGTLLVLNRLDAARAELEAAAADDPGSSCAHALLGRACAAAGDRRGALEAYHRVRDIECELRGEFVFEPLGVRARWGDARRGVEALSEGLRRHPDSTPMLVQRAGLLRDPSLCRYDDAIRDYRRAAALDPRRGWIAAHLARALNLRDGGDAGLAEFDRAAALAPGSGWIRAWRGAARARVGDTRRAEADFDAAAALMPWYSFTYAWRGALRRRLGRPREAAADLDAALALDPGYAFSWNERFQARLEAGDPAGAAEDLRVAHRMDPKYTWAEVRGARAARELDAAARRAPRSAWIKVWRGHARLLAGGAARAAADLKAAERSLPGEPLVAAWLGRALAACGKTAQARRRLERAARLDPASWGARKALADLSAAAGDWAGALPHLRRAVELAPTTVSLLVEHAAAAARLGKEEEALRSLDKALGLDPSYGAARELAARARLARAAKRAAAGDYAGQADDFRAALELAPGLFTPSERARLRALLKGAGRKKAGRAAGRAEARS